MQNLSKYHLAAGAADLWSKHGYEQVQMSIENIEESI